MTILRVFIVSVFNVWQSFVGQLETVRDGHSATMRLMAVAPSAAMVLLAAGFVLYDTSNVLHHYRTTQHVAAALALFASVALLFWYILQIVLAFSSRD